jgi:hypothetical protein
LVESKMTPALKELAQIPRVRLMAQDFTQVKNQDLDRYDVVLDIFAALTYEKETLSVLEKDIKLLKVGGYLVAGAPRVSFLYQNENLNLGEVLKRFGNGIKVLRTGDGNGSNSLVVQKTAEKFKLNLRQISLVYMEQGSPPHFVFRISAN